MAYSDETDFPKRFNIKYRCFHEIKSFELLVLTRKQTVTFKFKISVATRKFFHLCKKYSLSSFNSLPYTYLNFCINVREKEEKIILNYYNFILKKLETKTTTSK